MANVALVIFIVATVATGLWTAYASQDLNRRVQLDDVPRAKVDAIRGSLLRRAGLFSIAAGAALIALVDKIDSASAGGFVLIAVGLALEAKVLLDPRLRA